MKGDKVSRTVSSKYGDKNHEMWCKNCSNITTFTEWLDGPGGYLTGVICDSCGFDHQKSDEGIEYWNAHVYRKKCECGKEHKILTQEDRNPEYYTNVSIICSCGKAVTFELPVG